MPMTLCKKFLLLLPLLNRIDSILSFCRTIIFMVLPVLVLPQIFKMDGEWPSISAGEMLSLAMSIYYFVKFRNMWRASNPRETDAAEKPS